MVRTKKNLIRFSNRLAGHAGTLGLRGLIRTLKYRGVGWTVSRKQEMKTDVQEVPLRALHPFSKKW